MWNTMGTKKAKKEGSLVDFKSCARQLLPGWRQQLPDFSGQVKVKGHQSRKRSTEAETLLKRWLC